MGIIPFLGRCMRNALDSNTVTEEVPRRRDQHLTQRRAWSSQTPPGSPAATRQLRGGGGAYRGADEFVFGGLGTSTGMSVGNPTIAAVKAVVIVVAASTPNLPVADRGDHIERCRQRFPGQRELGRV